MSKTQHTPGPWELEDMDVVSRTTLIKCGAWNVAETFDACDRNDSNDNARRIVAAVNACEGISTEALEDGEIIKLQRDAERYRWLRDRLAIEDVERLEHEFLGYADEEESIKTDKAVDAAIAKAALEKSK